MTDERDEREADTAWLDEIKGDLNVEPSPAFAVRVRAAVEAEGEPGRQAWQRWMWMGAALAGAAAITVAMVMTRQPSRTNPSNVATAPQTAAVAPTPAVIPPKAADVTPSPAGARITAPRPSPASRDTTERLPPSAPVAVAATARLDLTVQTDQPDVIRRVWRSQTAGAIDPVTADLKFREALLASTAPPADVAEIVVEPISIKPLELPDMAAGRAGGVRLIAPDQD